MSTRTEYAINHTDFNSSFDFVFTFFSSIPKLRSLVARIGDSTADFEKMLSQSELTIRELCDSIRHKVDIARETALENIHKASHALMTEIDTYERDC